MRGDCSIRINGLGFTAEEISACAAKSGLLSIEIELSAAIQCDCTACRSSPRAVMSPQEILGLIDQARQLGARRVILIDSVAGPYPHLVEIIEHIRSKQMDVEWFAGATEITTELARFLFDHQVNVSVDFPAGWSLQAPPMAAEATTPLEVLKHAGYAPPSPVTPGEGRSEGVFNRQKSLEIQNHPHPNLLPEYPEKGPDYEIPRLAVRISVDDANIDQIPSIWRQARSNGIEPHVQIIKPPQVFSPERARDLFKELGEIDLSLGHAWDLPPELTGRSCKRHLFAVHASACGMIYACVGVTIPLGSIRTESLRDILTLSEVLEDLRDYGNKVKEPCRACSKTVDCYGCRGSAYQLTGDYLAGDQRCWKAQSTPIQTLPITINGLIPHGPSIRMVDRLMEIGERRASTSYTVGQDSPWIDQQGRLDDLAYIEIIAQSFAATHGFHLTPEQLAAHKGMLLGVTNLVIAGEAHAGQQLKIEIRKMTRFGDFGIVEGEVRDEDDRLIASGQMKVWKPSEEVARAMIG